MNRVFVGMIVFTLFSIAVAACGTEATPRDELGQMVDAQFRATESALQLKRIAVEATSRADATRQYLILQGQQTRVAQEANATATTHSAWATATAQAAQFTATTHAQSVQHTATAHAQSVAATGTAQSISAQATQVSASSTATANAANAQATQVSGNATATVIAAQVIVEQEKATWNQRLESLRAIASFIGVTLALIAAAVIVGFAAVRFVDAFVLRARVLRDKTGTVLVIGEKDKDGRQMVLIPGRSPGAALMIAPPGVTPLQIETGAMDEETTKRDQAVSLMIAATSGRSGGADELLAELTEGEQVRFVDEPPAQLVSGDVRGLLDGDWKQLGDGNGHSNQS
ncbi:MAG: hypothetical protein FJ009_05125 [Chloroflexi bacterium]|nr:hypothetical protein [Chloroflexota bacterium]